MSRPADRNGQRLGGSWSAATEQNDDRLRSGVMVNGLPAKVGAGDDWTYLARARCTGPAGTSCGQVVMEVWFLAPVANSGRTARYIAKAQAVDKVDCRPPRTRVVMVDLHETESVLSDCTAHGRIIVLAATLITTAQKAMAKVAHGSNKTGTVNAAPEGLALGHDLQRPRSFSSREEFRAWWYDHTDDSADTPS